MSSSNGQIVRGIYDALARGDVPAILGQLDPQVDWNEAEGFPYAGKYVGPDAVLQNVLVKLGTEWDGYSAIPDEFIDGGDTVAALGYYSGAYKATGKSFRAQFAHVWKLRDEKVVFFQQYTDTALVQEALKP